MAADLSGAANRGSDMLARAGVDRDEEEHMRLTGFAAKGLATAGATIALALLPATASAITIAGYWKVQGLSTSVVIHVLHTPGAPAQWGWSPDYLGHVSRPGGCYRQVPRSVWVIGFAGGGAFQQYTGTGCGPIKITTTRWFMCCGGQKLRQNYLHDPDGTSGPAPSRQIRLWWLRTSPRVTLRTPSYNKTTRRLVLPVCLEAVFAASIQARRDGRIVFAQAIPNGDGCGALTSNALAPGTYDVRLTARSGPSARLVDTASFTAS
jgi:hypothetical protein